MSTFTCNNLPDDRVTEFMQRIHDRALQIEKERAAMWTEYAPYAPRNRATGDTKPGSPESWYEPNPWKSPVQDQPNLVTLNQWATVTRKIEAARIRRKKRATTAKPTAA